MSAQVELDRNEVQREGETGPGMVAQGGGWCQDERLLMVPYLHLEVLGLCTCAPSVLTVAL